VAAPVVPPYLVTFLPYPELTNPILKTLVRAYGPVIQNPTALNMIKEEAKLTLEPCSFCIHKMIKGISNIVKKQPSIKPLLFLPHSLSIMYPNNREDIPTKLARYKVDIPPAAGSIADNKEASEGETPADSCR
jgi:hypothetical protein